jgi:hypothetical protein
MTQPELRTEPRVPVSYRGTLTLGETSTPCQIQNMCSRGFLIKYTQGLPVGHVLRLKCELPAKSIECKVQVRHVNADCLGARVIEISDEGKIVCQQFLAEQRAGSLKSATR